jgi:hypothetical protein
MSSFKAPLGPGDRGEGCRTGDDPFGRDVALALLLLVSLLSAAEPAGAQVRPFVFTVTTSSTTSEPGRHAWAAYYDAGYGERATEPFGYDGLEQRVGLQGRLGRGFTLLGHAAFGMGDEATRASQEAELLKDLLGPASSLRLALGLGARREWEGTTAALARVCVGWSGRRTLLFGNLRLEKPFAFGRDAVDLIITLGWLQEVRRGLRVGLEAVGEDLEGFWEAEEAEGGAKLYAGPALHWSAPTERLWLSAGGGPIVYATRNGRTSPAPRPLQASGNGFTVRVAVGLTF